MNKRPIWVGCDHAGFALKRLLLTKFPELNWRDQGTDSDTSVDYPDYAEKVATQLKSHPSDVGLLICGSAQGMAIKANRYPWIRAAVAWNEEVARLARSHNNANVLCLAARLVDPAINEKILMSFLNSTFEGGRHQRRVEKL